MRLHDHKYSSYLQGLVWIYYLGHAGVQGNKWTDLLASRVSVAETITMDNGWIVKIKYGCMLVDDTRMGETVRSEQLSFELSVIHQKDESDTFTTRG